MPTQRQRAEAGATMPRFGELLTRRAYVDLQRTASAACRPTRRVG